MTYDETKPFAKAVAETMEKGMPELVVSRQTKTLRKGKVLVDWGQNDRREVDGLRLLAAREGAADGLDAASRGRSSTTPAALVFEWNDALERVERDGDLFAPVLTLKQELPAG